ncbi:MAG TPA: hypothetical protein VHB25_03085 [Gemmatimonadaceae bacterium]|nr:hypothetical protein [Gemmatimonadaceae bacterium]
MWSALRWLVLRVTAVNWLFKTLGGLAILVPIAFVLKIVGLPLLAVLSVLALPVLLMLFVFGLPIFLVLIVGGMVMGLLGMVLALGIAAIKIGLFVVLPIWLVFKLVSWIFRKRPADTPPESPAPPPPPEPDVP